MALKYLYYVLVVTDDGGKFVGKFKHGERHGKGKIYYPDGDHFKTYEAFA